MCTFRAGLRVVGVVGEGNVILANSMCVCIYIEREDIGNADGEEGVNQYQMMKDLLSTRRELQSTMQVLYEATHAQGDSRSTQVHKDYASGTRVALGATAGGDFDWTTPKKRSLQQHENALPSNPRSHSKKPKPRIMKRQPPQALNAKPCHPKSIKPQTLSPKP